MTTANPATIDSGLFPRGTIDYDALDALNWSSLKAMDRSPKAYKAQKTTPRKDTKALALGRLTHTATLEPHRLELEYMVWDGGRRYGRAWDEFSGLAEERGMEAVTQEEMTTATAIASAVHADGIAGPLLEASRGRAELAMVWLDSVTGYRCKGRADWLRHDNVLVDLKSAREVDALGFGRAAGEYLYHAQLAFYTDALEQLIGDRPIVKIVAVEKESPFDVVVYSVSETILRAGQTLYRKLLGRLSDCLLRGEWPGVAAGQELPLVIPGIDSETAPLDRKPDLLTRVNACRSRDLLEMLRLEAKAMRPSMDLATQVAVSAAIKTALDRITKTAVPFDPPAP